MLRRLLPASVLLAFASPAAAQSFNQAIIFGDSSVDSGYYKLLPNPGGGATYDSLWASAIAAGAGAPTTNPGLVNSQFLASYFGLSANPANQPGGTNYATSGAKDVTVNTAATGGFQAAIPTVTQISNYLSANGGVANPNALYLISSGGNDVSYALGLTGTGPFPTNPIAYLTSAADSLASAIAGLHAAGARYIIVPDQAYSFPTDSPTEQAAKLSYSLALWNALAADGVNFIPADFNAVRLAIQANPSEFGFINVGTGPGQFACTQPAGVTTAWALLCSSNPASPSHLVSPNAEFTDLFADDQHLTTAGQKIEADYYYSLIVAPSEISFLAETPVKTQSMLINTIQNQLPISNNNRGPAGYNAWVSGDISSLTMNSNYNGFPGDPGTPIALTAGFDFKNYGWLYGVAFSANYTQQSFTLLPGYYAQDGASASLYAAYLDHPLWFDVIGTLGYFHDSINRQVPLGVALLTNNGYTSAYDPSIAGEIGYNFLSNVFGGQLKQGPVTGVALQRVNVGAFTETGSVTSLSFDSQVRDSAISELGYQAAYTFGIYEPFAKFVWNHEWADTNRDVTASLTTISAPAYSMPAVVLGKDWGTATVGTSAKIAQNVKGFVFLTGEFAQDQVTVYGGQLGVNVAF
jgi:outer membrane lipase/esterase